MCEESVRWLLICKTTKKKPGKLCSTFGAVEIGLRLNNPPRVNQIRALAVL